MTVLLICLAHAVPVVLAGLIFGKAGPIALAAVISGLIGVLTGNPLWVVLDLFAVVLAYQLAMKFVPTEPHAPETPEQRARWEGELSMMCEPPTRPLPMSTRRVTPFIDVEQILRERHEDDRQS